MGAFGQKLKSEREKRKITLDEVAVATKIGVRMLQALEEEKFGQLPGGIFNKNFVRSYAHFLGLNEQQAVADYMAAAGPGPEPLPDDEQLRAIAERKEKERHRPQSAGIPWGIVAAVLLVLSLGLSVWGFYSRDRAQAEGEYAGKHAVSVPYAATQSSKNQPSQSAEQSSSVAGNAVASGTPVMLNASATESVPNSSELGTEKAVSQGTEPTPAATNSSAATGQTFSVSVTARDNSWLTLTVDGNILHHGMFSAQSEKTVDAQKEVILKAGNIGGLEVSFNGKKLPQQGGEGEVRILTFHATGLEPQ